MVDRVFSLGDFQQAQPVACRIDLRGGAAVGRHNRFEVELLPRLGVDPCRVHQPVPADEDLVARSRQIRQDVASLVVGDHNSGELRRQLRGFRDHPHAGLGTFRARDDAADVIGIDGDRGTALLLRVHPGERRRQRSAMAKKPTSGFTRNFMCSSNALAYTPERAAAPKQKRTDRPSRASVRDPGPDGKEAKVSAKDRLRRPLGE